MTDKSETEKWFDAIASGEATPNLLGPALERQMFQLEVTLSRQNRVRQVWILQWTAPTHEWQDGSVFELLERRMWQMLDEEELWSRGPEDRIAIEPLEFETTRMGLEVCQVY